MYWYTLVHGLYYNAPQPVVCSHWSVHIASSPVLCSHWSVLHQRLNCVLTNPVLYLCLYSVLTDMNCTCIIFVLVFVSQEHVLCSNRSLCIYVYIELSVCILIHLHLYCVLTVFHLRLYSFFSLMCIARLPALHMFSPLCIAPVPVLYSHWYILHLSLCCLLTGLLATGPILCSHGVCIITRLCLLCVLTGLLCTCALVLCSHDLCIVMHICP
jgi:hypothetical protein